MQLPKVSGHKTELFVSSDCPDILINSPDRVTVRGGARYAQATKQYDPVRSHLDSKHSTIVQELKAIQDGFQQQLLTKITETITEQISCYYKS